MTQPIDTTDETTDRCDECGALIRATNPSEVSADHTPACSLYPANTKRDPVPYARLTDPEGPDPMPTRLIPAPTLTITGQPDPAFTAHAEVTIRDGQIRLSLHAVQHAKDVAPDMPAFCAFSGTVVEMTVFLKGLLSAAETVGDTQ